LGSSCRRPAAYTKKYVDFEKFRAFKQKGWGNLTRTRLRFREGKLGIILNPKAFLERKSSEFFSKSPSLYRGGSGKMKKYGGNITKYEGKMKKYEGICRKYEEI